MRFDRRKRSRYCKGTRLPGRRHLENTVRLMERKGALGTGWIGRRETLGMKLTRKKGDPGNEVDRKGEETPKPPQPQYMLRIPNSTIP